MQLVCTYCICCLRTLVLFSAFIAQHLSLFDCVCGKQCKVIFLFDSAGPLMFQMINFCTEHPINLFFKPAFFYFILSGFVFTLFCLRFERHRASLLFQLLVKSDCRVFIRPKQSPVIYLKAKSII